MKIIVGSWVLDKIRLGFDNCTNGSGHKMVYYTALSSFLCLTFSRVDITNVLKHLFGD